MARLASRQGLDGGRRAAPGAAALRAVTSPLLPLALLAVAGFALAAGGWATAALGVAAAVAGVALSGST